jgi:hypothetical protein
MRALLLAAVLRVAAREFGRSVVAELHALETIVTTRSALASSLGVRR